MPIQNIKIVTTHTFPGKEIKEVLGLVKDVYQVGGITVPDKEHHVGILFHRLAEKAYEMGANAILNVRLQNVSITSGGSDIVAYGTAVKV